jgi:hypothetical protein
VASAVDVWQPIRDAIDKFALLKNTVVSVGNASGQLFLHEKGTTKFDTDMHIASASKWIAGVTIMKGVQDGHLKLTDLVSDHLDYWTKNSSDPRSRITLKHVLSFQDGYVTGSTSCPENQFMACVKHIHDNVKHSGEEPGTSFHYNELHLQIGMAMLVSATGRTSATAHVDLVKEAVFKPAGMEHTIYENPSNPDFSSSIHTRASDYEKFLHMYTTHKLVSKDIYDEMGVDHFPDSKFPFPANILGHYGLANWYECFAHFGKWRDACTTQHAMSCMGAEGYWPMDCRKQQYYFQIATTGGPQNSAILKEQIKPLLDAIVTGQPVPSLPMTAEECSQAAQELKEPLDRLFGKSSKLEFV